MPRCNELTQPAKDAILKFNESRGAQPLVNPNYEELKSVYDCYTKLATQLFLGKNDHSSARDLTRKPEWYKAFSDSFYADKDAPGATEDEISRDIAASISKLQKVVGDVSGWGDAPARSSRRG